MAERNASEGRGLATVLNVLLIVATVAGGVLLARSELTSDRPPVHPALRSQTIGRQSIDVRLWEDPLAAKPNPGEGDGRYGGRGDAAKDAGRCNARWAVEITGNEGLKTEPRGLVILPVMVPGGPYSEDQESRIRARFAVVSALGQRGYVPRDQQHIGEVSPCWQTEEEFRLGGADQRRGQASETQQQVPTAPQAMMSSGTPDGSSSLVLRYEWYLLGQARAVAPEDASVPEGVLVLWLDERQFSDVPLRRLDQLLGPLLASVDRSRAAGTSPATVRVIGPRSSDVLRNMVPCNWARELASCAAKADAESPSPAALQRVELYSATASVMTKFLVRDECGSTTGPCIREACPSEGRACLVKALRAGGLKNAYFFNADDGQMANEILAELQLRGVDVVGDECGPADQVVLLSERDTFFGRMLSETYESALGALVSSRRSRSKASAECSGRKTKQGNLHTFTFLRGLDGKTVCNGSGRDCDKPKERRERDGRPSSMEEIVAWSPQANKAEGPGQFDYLVRTGDQIAKRREELRAGGNGDIKAIGIVGSDVYDVLLILQALRPRFPDVLFFTTELDARYLDPTQREWARNLIVASSYGLTLDQALQAGVSPFRDSAQSALFAATLAALTPSASQPEARLTPPASQPEAALEPPASQSKAAPSPSATPPEAAVASRPKAVPASQPDAADGEEALRVVAVDGVAPRRFEVGNKTFVDLSTVRTDSALVHPPTRSDRPEKAPIGTAAAVIVLLALLVGLAVYYVFNPFRGRAPEELGYVSVPLALGEADIGGADGAKLLMDALDVALARQDPVAKWFAERLRQDYAIGIGKEPEAHQEPSRRWSIRDALVTLAGLDPSAQARRHAAELEKQERPERRTSALVELLNGILHHKVTIEKTVFAGSGLTDAALVASAAPWDPPIAWSRGLARMRQRQRTRQMLDDLLDRLTAIAGKNDPYLRFASDARRCAVKMLRIRVQLVRLVVGVVCAALVVAAGLAASIWRDTYLHAEGEPFSLVSGTSAWPNVILRVFSTFLAIGFGIVLIQRLRYMFFDLTRRYWFPFSDTTTTTEPKDFAPATISAASLWRTYYQYGHPKMRLLRASVPTVVYFAFGQLLLGLLGFPFQPLRGTAVALWSKGDLWPFVLSFLLLSFLTIDAALRCRRFVQQIASLPTKYPITTLKRFQRGRISETYLEEWIDVQLIADLTERVGGLLWFPSIVFCVMLASLIQWTDHWPTPPGLLIVLGINFSIAIASVVILQRAAQQARDKAEESLDAKVKGAQALAARSPAENDEVQAQKLLDEIRNLRRGAFVGFWESPVLGAAMVPSGGTALLQLLFWFSNG